jgi:nucleoside triphosphate diphosphatase
LSLISIERLKTIMQELREPNTGCPWDLKQDYQSIIPYTIEEVYEVADAIERENYTDLRDELGDLLFQVVFYAQLASEDGYFNLDDVIHSICEKLERRHPHVFGQKTQLSEQQIAKAWEDIKAQERNQKSEDRTTSLLDDIPKVLPELKRAQKIQSRVAKQGFDWPDVSQVWKKLDEESLEVKHAVDSGEQPHIEEELGDLLFVCVNLARHYKVDADRALMKANNKFCRRFKHIESLAQKPISEYSLEELEAFWQASKKRQ